MGAGRVFISHCVKDHEGVQELVRYLEARDIFVWIAPRDVRPGLDYSEQIQEAIEQCSAFLVIVTEGANASLFVRAETEMAFSSRRPIFPVRFGEMEPAKGLRLFLNIHHWTNAFGPDSPSNLQRLATELAALAGVADAPAAPAVIPAVPETPPPEEPPSDAGPDAFDVPTLSERGSFLTRPRLAAAAAAAMLLSLTLAWPLVTNRGDAASAAERPASRGEVPAPGGNGNVAAEPAGARKPAVTADPAPAARAAAVQTLGGGTRTAAPRRASANPVPASSSRRTAPRPARAAAPSLPPTRTQRVRTQMRCRQFTVAESGSSDRHRSCQGQNGMVTMG